MMIVGLQTIAMTLECEGGPTRVLRWRGKGKIGFEIVRWRREEEDEMVNMVPFFKPKGFSLAKSFNLGNKIFLGNKEENDVFWLLGEGGIPTYCTGFFGGGSTNVGGLKLKVGGIFSWGINCCLFIQSNLPHSCCWNSKSWPVNWTLGLMMEMGLRNFFSL